MNIRTLINRHPLIGFVAINYAISWAFLFPALQSLKHAKTFTPLALLGMVGQYGPSIAAVIVLAATRGAPGVRAAFRRFLRWRVHFVWYLFVLLVPLCIYTLAVWVSARPNWAVSQGLLGIPLAFLLALPFGPLGEELGWRGFLLPELLRRHGPFKSTVILGLIWSTWHLASFTYPGAAIPAFEHVSAYSIFLFFCANGAVAFLFTYVFIRTGGSLLLMVLLHMAYNASDNVAGEFFPSLEKAGVAVNEHVYITSIVLTAAIGVGCVLLNDRRRARARNGEQDDGALPREEGRL